MVFFHNHITEKYLKCRQMNRDSAYQPKYKYTYHKCFFYLAFLLSIQFILLVLLCLAALLHVLSRVVVLSQLCEVGGVEFYWTWIGKPMAVVC